jgi:inhibitor of cysteine peptidase
MKKGTLARMEAMIVSLVLVGGLLIGIVCMIACEETTGFPTTNALISHVPAHPLGAMVVSENLGDGKLLKFASLEELQEYVKGRPFYDYCLFNGQPGIWLYADSSSAKGEGEWTEAPDYSKTNIQVEGVDEADIVKTDGKYIYLILSDRIVIVDARPADEAKVLCEIKLQGQLSGMYINGDNLVIFETVWEQATAGEVSKETIVYNPYIAAYPKTHIKVYDVSDHQNPVLKQDVAVDGSYWNSRMIGDYVYVIVTQDAYSVNGKADLPTIYLGETILDIPAVEILHPEEETWGSSYTTLLSFNVTEKVEDISYLGYGSFVLGSASNLYVSQNNIYIACTEYDYIAEAKETTSVHRICLNSGQMEYVATGEVPGTLLNQFSMDEYDSCFRVVTTTDWDKHSVYILDESLNIVGRLEDFAPQWEQFHSARFMGKRCYLVTFRQTDPLFVVDLGDPTSPKVLGELIIPGYSDYLHPYDETHLIGVGKAANSSGRFQGLKISLFDVSDVSNPKEIANYEIGNHKALLFDRARNLLVIPVLLAETKSGSPDWQWGEYTWQGAYVFHISPEKGIELRGRITHHKDGDFNQTDYYWHSSGSDVKRSLYIGNVLYTISDAKIKMNNLDSLEQINELGLPEVQSSEPVVTWQSPQVWASSSTSRAFNG